jgi:hypothetical protein
MRKLKEETEGAMNNAGGGSVDGIGVGERGEPGFYKKRKSLRSIIKKNSAVRSLFRRIGQ